jgi:hypothetical protein
MAQPTTYNFWTQFWHVPVRAERLALTRIAIGLALLTDLLVQYLPHLALFYGPQGVAPAGVNDWWRLQNWQWTVLVLNTDEMNLVYLAFGLWMAATVAFLVGWHTRWTSVLLWFVTLCFHNRNRSVLNFGDHVVEIALFLLMCSPCGRALSIDAWRQRKKRARADRPVQGSATTPAWPVRLFQIQLCVIYFSTGLAKLVTGLADFVTGETPFLEGTWWEGTSIHYALNNMTLARWSYAQIPVPLWVTAPLTYISVGWEVLFPFLVLSRWTRKWTLWFGILFHLGIWLVLEVGWFSFYSIAFYGVWVPDRFWERLDKRGAGIKSNPEA